jgi:GDP-4-dehydro-6-deoxy-D-mannose reductase
MRTLITGAAGFVGGHLAELLLRDGGHEVHGLGRRAAWPPALAHLTGRVRLHAVDLARADAIEALLRDLRPERIFHLAGYANTGKSFREPAAAWADNLQATFNLYEAVARTGLRPRILFASTGLIYGAPVGDCLCREDDPLEPASPYACSKAAADLLSYQVTRHPGLDVVRARCFNMIGARQAADYATANFARQIAAAEAGVQAPVIETGDLSGRRDLTDVRDVVRAFVALLESGATGAAYNAGSGVAHSMQEVLDRMRALARVRIDVRQQCDPARKGEAAVSRADVAKLHAATGWRPSYTLDESLADLIDYWRRQAEPRRVGA